MSDELGDLARLEARLARLASAVPVADRSLPALGAGRARVRPGQPLGLVGLSAGLVIVAVLAVAIGPHAPLAGNSSPSPNPSPSGSTPASPTADVTSWYADGLPMTIAGEQVYRASQIAKLGPASPYLVAAWDLGPLAFSCPAQIVGQSNPPCPRFESLADAESGPQALVAAWAVDDAPGPAMVLRATTEPSPSCFSDPPGGCPTVPEIRVQAVVWIGQPSPATPAPAVSAASVDAAGSFGTGGLWATRSGILDTSTDGGRSWKAAASPFTTPGACVDSGIGCATPFVLDARHAWVINTGPGSTEFTGSASDVLKLVLDRTTDGGATWSHVSIPGSYPGTTQSLVFLDADHGFLLCGWTRMSPISSALLRTDDGGATWRVVSTAPRTIDVGGIGSMFAVSDATTLWAGAEGDAGPIGRPLFDVSHDAGATWTPVDLPGLSGQLGGAMNYMMAPPTFGPVALVSVVSGTENGNVTTIYRSTDGGTHWSLASLLQREASAGLVVLDLTHWLLPVSNGLGLIATADGGKTWHDVATSGLSSDWVLAMAAADPSDLIAVVATGNSQPGPEALFVSHDGGLTWSPGRLG